MDRAHRAILWDRGELSPDRSRRPLALRRGSARARLHFLKEDLEEAGRRIAGGRWVTAPETPVPG
jgi:hypothetical protein